MTPPSAPPVERLDLPAFDRAVDGLAALLQACVDAGASVSFLAPLPRDEARAFWTGLRPAVASGERVVLLTRQDGEVTGTVQLGLGGPPNGAHRAEVLKLLVHPGARRRGLGGQLMRAAEAEARRCGRMLLVLDTRRGDDGERLYRALGWATAGVIPGYARSSDGTLADTAFMYRNLEPDSAPRLSVGRASAHGPEAAPLLDGLSELLGRAYGSDGRAAFASWNDADPRAVFALARLGGHAVGCGAIRPLEEGVAELKRMYATVPRAGVGSAVLAFLEAEARAMGYSAVWLETRWANEAAVTFYRRHGYRPRENFGPYRGRPESACLEKPL